LPSADQAGLPTDTTGPHFRTGEDDSMHQIAAETRGGLAALIIATGLVAAPGAALAGSDRKSDSDPLIAPSSTAAPVAKARSAVPDAVVDLVAAPRGETRFTAYLTGYTWWDNTPPGSAEISKPVVHRKAGGLGTFDDPVTIAVGHRIEGGRQTLDYPAGTRFYIEKLRKYAIVEDVCGDGNTPQAGPCHTGYRGHPWLDIYIGGGRESAAASDACARRITALQAIVINPGPGYPVHAGEIAASGCRVF
jgi:hypothetical protein